MEPDLSDEALPYREALLEHYRRPRNRGDLTDASVVGRASNPLCGDEVEVGVGLHDGLVSWVRFRGRGCAICIASASLMTEAVSGKSRSEGRALAAAMRAWIAPEAQPLPEPMTPLAPVRAHPTRHRCALLPWEALDRVLAAD